MNSRTCPNCRGLLESDGTCTCGYGAARKRRQEQPQQKLCAFNDHGMRCPRIGHMANTTNGEGPWYCREHFARIMGWEYTEPTEDESMHQAAVDVRVNRIVPRLQGESEHDWSMRCRDWVFAQLGKIGREPARMREPGED